MRRCDHDSDGALSYQEFMGLVEEFPVDSTIQIVKGNVGDNAFGA